LTGQALKAPRPLKAESAKTGEQVEQFLDRIADASGARLRRNTGNRQGGKRAALKLAVAEHQAHTKKQGFRTPIFSFQGFSAP